MSSHFRSAVKSALLIGSLTTCTVVSGQFLQSAPQSTCGFDQAHQRLMRDNPDYRHSVQDFNEAAQHAPPGEDRDINTYKVPVVVHVMEIPGVSVTDDQIRAGIKLTNEY